MWRNKKQRKKNGFFISKRNGFCGLDVVLPTEKKRVGLNVPSRRRGIYKRVAGCEEERERVEVKEERERKKVKMPPAVETKKNLVLY